jgi:KUP system potassium uptake protein
VQGTAVFLSASTHALPAALLHNLKHNQVLHETIVLLTVQVEDVPQVSPERRAEFHPEGHGFYRMVLHYGFMEDIDIPRELSAACTGTDLTFEPLHTSYFLSRQKLIACRAIPGMALWREHLFAWMLKVSESAMDFFKLPTNRVIELGSQLRI